jgi:hypothetical protein
MDYQAWASQVRSFSEALRKLPGEVHVKLVIEPPLVSSDLPAIVEKWSGKLPSELVRLWTGASRQIDFRYSWTPPPSELFLLQEVFECQRSVYGGVRFNRPDDIYPGNSGAEPDDDLMADTVGQEGLELWCRCAVFLQIGNGDCLALDPRRAADDPAVVYLSHDGDDSGFIAPSFTEFLHKWADLCFIGPECWLLDYWLDRDSGTLELTKHKTAELRQLLLRGEDANA